jgi:hypothetical protein
MSASAAAMLAISTTRVEAIAENAAAAGILIIQYPSSQSISYDESI